MGEDAGEGAHFSANLQALSSLTPKQRTILRLSLEGKERMDGIMKKTLWTRFVGYLVGTAALCAWTGCNYLGVAVDGKIYVFSGTQGSYVAGGKTFIIGEDSVTIRQSGMPDRVLALAPIAGDVETGESRRVTGSSLTAVEEAGDQTGEVLRRGTMGETAGEDVLSASMPGLTPGEQAQESGR